MRTKKDYLALVFKGMSIGAADVVPGVSGGTIALILGIYEELINSIKGVNKSSLKMLFSLKFKEFWGAINGNFLLSISGGILISIYSLARAATYMLDNHPALIWSFFFGLVLSSIYYVSKGVSKWNIKAVISFAIGAVVAFLVTIATPTDTPNTTIFIFISGMIAICAMILPGVSGSFILLLLGKYDYIMTAVKEFKVLDISIFAAGAVVGVALFSRILSYLLNKFYNITIALLAGFMLGSLNKVWPWKESTEIVTGHTTFQLETNILPTSGVME